MMHRKWTDQTSVRRLAILISVILIGVWPRWHALTLDARLHPDEALFSTFARRAALNGDWLLPGALDKPPLSIYAISLSMIPFTEWRADGLPDLRLRLAELAARAPSAFASLLIIPLVYIAAHRLYDEETALLAAALTSLSPFLVAFSATAFTDGLMLMWLAAALACAGGGRALWAGVCLALGFACKPQALLFVPLVMAVIGLRCGLRWRSFAHALWPIAITSAALLLWDGARAQPTGFFVLGFVNNDPFSPIGSDDILPRLAVWTAHFSAMLHPATWLFVGLAVTAWAARVFNHRWRGLAVDLTLGGWCIAYGLLHWLTAINTYDRYLLPLALPFMLLAARGALALLHWWRRRLPVPEFAAASIVVLLVMWGSTQTAADGQLDVGADRDKHEGIDRLAQYLDALPLGTILYDRWLGWELDFYLGQWSDKRRVYYPTPDVLAADALLQPDPAPRYFVAPRWEDAQPWLSALDAAGFSPELEVRLGHFEVYRLLPPLRQDG